MVKNVKGPEQNGLRDGINKKEIMKSMTDDDFKRIKLLHELMDNKNIKEGDDAYKCGIRTDQMVIRFEETQDSINTHLTSVLQSARRIEQNDTDIKAGETEQTLPTTNFKLTLRDLEIENLQHYKIIRKGVRELRIGVYTISFYVGVQRLDREIMFPKEEYTKFINGIKEELGKNKIDLYL